MDLRTLFALISLYFISCQALCQQDTICSTKSVPDSVMQSMPWFGDEAYIYDLLDSLGYSQPSGPTSSKRVKPYDIPHARYRVPVKFWFYHDNFNYKIYPGPTNVPDPFDPEYASQLSMDRLNHIYSGGEYSKFPREAYTYRGKSTPALVYDILNQNPPNSGILFYMDCEIGIENRSKRHVVQREQEARKIGKDNFRPHRLNVHYPWKYEPTGGTFFGPESNAGYYVSSKNFIFLGWNHIYESRRISTLPHEAGHAFLLEHTHRNSHKKKCKQEPVSRTRKFTRRFQHGCVANLHRNSKRCNVAGDYLCDTYASPELGGNYKNSTCIFTDGGAKDRWGDLYISKPPQANNIMGYANCRNRFTWGQIGVMVADIERRRKQTYGISEGEPKHYFDRFEPDNTMRMARLFELNDLQHHSFHWVKGQWFGTFETDYECDQDWVKFRIENVPQTVRIATDVGHSNLADTYLDLYKSDGTWLAADDNGNGNGFSLLDNQTLQPGTYYLQVTKLNPNPADDVRDYVLDISECYPETLCTYGWVFPGEVKRYATRGDLTVPCPNEALIVLSGGELQLRSQTRVVMKPGFRAEEGSVFRAKIEPAANLTCDDNSSFYEIHHGSNKRGPDPFARAKYDYRTFPGKEAYLAQLSEAYGPGELPAAEDFPDYAYETAQLGRRPPTEAQIEVFPNPFRSEVTLRLGLPDDEKITVEVYSVVGKRVTQLMNREPVNRGYHERTFDLSGLPGGAYVCKVWIGGEFQTFKLMKE